MRRSPSVVQNSHKASDPNSYSQPRTNIPLMAHEDVLEPAVFVARNLVSTCL